MRPPLGFMRRFMREVYAEVYAVAHRCGKISAEFFSAEKHFGRFFFGRKHFWPNLLSAMKNLRYRLRRLGCSLIVELGASPGCPSVGA